jgi:hypothetical protein
LLNNSLILNAGKTDFLIAGTKQQLIKCGQKTISICGVLVKSKPSVRYLGVEIDQNLKLDKQISNVSRKAYGALRILYKHIRYLNMRSRRLLVDALVGSHLNFCMSLYHGLPKKQLKKMERIVRAMKRYIEGVDKTPIDHKWLTLDQRIAMRMLVLTHNILSGKSAIFLHNLLSFSESTRNLRSTSNNDLKIPRTKRAISNRAFQVAAPILWNRLPAEVRRVKSVNGLKEKFIELQ